NGNASIQTVIGTGFTTYSDSVSKRNIQPFHSGTDVLRQINTISFNYNGKAHLPTDKTFIGVIAEDVRNCAPYAVDTFYAKLDTTDTEPTALLAVKNEAIMYTAVNSIKELDTRITGLEQTVPPAKPILISPVNGATEVPLEVTFTWHAAERATSYRIVITTSRTAIERLVSDTFLVMTFPAYCTAYRWWVEGINIGGTGIASDEWSFTTATPAIPDAPVLISPADSASELPLSNKFTWNASEMADGYQLYISSSPDYSRIIDKISTTDTSVFASVPSYSTLYYWWCVAYNCGGKSTESDIWSFTTQLPPPPPAPPVLALPANGDTTGAENVILSWYKATGATGYKVFVSLTPDDSKLIYQSFIKDTFALVKTEFDKIYYWWVVACNPYACGEKSEVWHFL
ncbi:MAG: tail fiber domain-containing protein, partial [Bacteroidia bacterium]|nr:tail fiber domain-containing protein [Bacteroidia bacterium]